MSKSSLHVVLIGAECEENLALRYLWSALEKEGHRVSLIAFNHAAETERVARELGASNADLAGLSMVFTYRAREFAQVAMKAREYGYRGHLTAGGHFAAFHAEDLLRDVPALDSIAIGEGEAIITALAANLEGLGQVEGVVWRDRSGKILRNAPAVKPVDLDDLPWPRRKQPADSYLGLPIANLLSSRGCTHACAFCSISAWHRLCGGDRLRVRRAAAVAAEVAVLYHQGYRIFNFHDDNFFLRDRDAMCRRVDELAAELGRRNVGRIAFAVKARPDSVDYELFARLRDLGMFRVFLGIEAGTRESLRRLGRGQQLEDNERALSIVNDLDLHACFNLLLLNPDSTLADFRANVDFLRRHPQNPINFCRTEIYTGTPLAARLRRQGRLRNDYWGYGYTIADRQAQEVFELMFRGMFDHHHAPNNVHHLTMTVDYEHQLLGRFHQTTPALRAAVKQFVMDVNRQTCGDLDRLAQTAALGLGDRAQEEFLKEFRAQLAAADWEAAARAASLLGEIRDHARKRETRAAKPSWRHTAMRVGVAASLAVSLAACFQTHAYEMVPPTQGENADPEPVGEEAARNLPAGNAEEMKAELQRQALRQIAAQIQPAKAIDIELWVSADGHVVFVGLYQGGIKREVPELTAAQQEKVRHLIVALGGKRQERKAAELELMQLGRGVLPLLKSTLLSTRDPEIAARCSKIVDRLEQALTVDTREQILKYLRSLTFRGTRLAGKRFLVSFTEEEVTNAGIRDEDTHIFEMAPAPRD